jgi:acetylornithine aminotransferase
MVSSRALGESILWREKKRSGDRNMGILVVDELLSDPRLTEAKEMILRVMAERQNKLTGIREPDPDLKQGYENLVNEFEEIRGGPLFYKYIGSGLGNGALVELADGSVKYDFISGIGAHHWGHNHPAIVEACLDAAVRDTVMQGNLQQNLETVELARSFLEAAQYHGARLKHCFFTTSGAMANENALKLILSKKQGANRLVAFENCFMGRTLTLSQITDKPEYRKGLPESVHINYIPFFDSLDPVKSRKASTDCLKRLFSRYPDSIGLMAFELVLGEGGFYPGDPDFFRSLMEICKENNAAILVDEVQTFGRTTEPFAFQHYGLDDYVDVVTVGKLTQVCATLFTEEYAAPPGLLSQTFIGATSAIKASQIIVKGLLRGGFFGQGGRIGKMHDYIVERLEMIGKQTDGAISGPYGLGAMIGFTVFDGGAEITKEFIHRLFDEGVIAFYAGKNPTRVRFLLPMGMITSQIIDSALVIVERLLIEMRAER